MEYDPKIALESSIFGENEFPKDFKDTFMKDGRMLCRFHGHEDYLIFLPRSAGIKGAILDLKRGAPEMLGAFGGVMLPLVGLIAAGGLFLTSKVTDSSYKEVELSGLEGYLANENTIKEHVIFIKFDKIRLVTLKQTKGGIFREKETTATYDGNFFVFGTELSCKFSLTYVGVPSDVGETYKELGLPVRYQS